MVTRLYFPSTTAADVTPDYSTSWTGVANADRRKCVRTKQATAMASKSANALAGSGAEFVLNRQYVSEPLSAQTIAGHIKGQFRCLESATGFNGTIAIHIRVCNREGTSFTGTILALTASDVTSTTPPEFATSLTNRRLQDVNEAFSLTLASLDVNQGDRLVIEIGCREVGTTTTRTGSINCGDNSATDLGENTTDTAAYNPWIEFDSNVLFEGLKTYTIDDLFRKTSIRTSATDVITRKTSGMTTSIDALIRKLFTKTSNADVLALKRGLLQSVGVDVITATLQGSFYRYIDSDVCIAEKTVKQLLADTLLEKFRIEPSSVDALTQKKTVAKPIDLDVQLLAKLTKFISSDVRLAKTFLSAFSTNSFFVKVAISAINANVLTRKTCNKAMDVNVFIGKITQDPPYVIYGICSLNGVLQTSANVVVRNVTKSEQSTVVTNSAGEFAIDLNDLNRYPSGYAVGDSITATCATIAAAGVIDASWGLKLDIRGRTWTADALFRKTRTQTLSTDVLALKRGVTDPFSVDVKLLKRLRQCIDAETAFSKRYAKNIDVVALFSQTLLKTWLADVMLRKLRGNCIDADMYTQKTRFNAMNTNTIVLKRGLTKLFTVNAIFKGTLIKQIAVDTRLGKMFGACFDADLVMLKKGKYYINVDVALKKFGVTKFMTVNAVFKKLGISKAFSADTEFNKRYSTQLLIDILLQKMKFTKLFSANVVTSKRFSKPFNADIRFKKLGITKPFSADTEIAKPYSKQFSIDALLRKLNRLQTLGVDVRTMKQFTKSLATDLIVGKSLTSEVSAVIDALFLKYNRTASFNADVHTRDTFTTAISTNVLLQKLMSTALQADIIISNLFGLRLLAIDVLTKRYDATSAFSANALLSLLNTLNVQADLILAKLHTVGLAVDVNALKRDRLQTASVDASFRKLRTIAAQADAVFKQMHAVTIAVDWLASTSGRLKTANVDAMFRGLKLSMFDADSRFVRQFTATFNTNALTRGSLTGGLVADVLIGDIGEIMVQWRIQIESDDYDYFPMECVDYQPIAIAEEDSAPLRIECEDV